MFFKGSRYEGVETHETEDEQGRPVRYKKVRRIPYTPGRLAHQVREDERLDHVAHRYYRDPERFWRICDANLTLWPEELVSETGRIIVIPPAQGEEE